MKQAEIMREKVQQQTNSEQAQNAKAKILVVVKDLNSKLLVVKDLNYL